ncbi:hypothetical protein C8R44DRAFT_975949 [Mycena epipterygia]|nr:hypothetical protein C8R44DRAFT_975949 [Mycena epipterygia]
MGAICELKAFTSLQNYRFTNQSPLSTCAILRRFGFEERGDEDRAYTPTDREARPLGAAFCCSVTSPSAPPHERLLPLSAAYLPPLQERSLADPYQVPYAPPLPAFNRRRLAALPSARAKVRFLRTIVRRSALGWPRVSALILSRPTASALACSARRFRRPSTLLRGYATLWHISAHPSRLLAHACFLQLRLSARRGLDKNHGNPELDESLGFWRLGCEYRAPRVAKLPRRIFCPLHNISQTCYVVGFVVWA